MANKKFITKNGLQTQNIDFVSPNNSNTIQVQMLDTDTLSFIGQSGQLFSISDNFSGTIYSVNDAFGLPSIQVKDTGTIILAQYSGNVGIGTFPIEKFHVSDGKTLFAASTIDKASINIPSGVNPSSPIQGDLWTDAFGDLKYKNATTTITLGSGGGGSQNVFSTISVSGQSDIVADSTADTLTFVAGSSISITTDSFTDSITISSMGATIDDSIVNAMIFG